MGRSSKNWGIPGKHVEKPWGAHDISSGSPPRKVHMAENYTVSLRNDLEMMDIGWNIEISVIVEW